MTFTERNFSLVERREYNEVLQMFSKELGDTL